MLYEIIFCFFTVFGIMQILGIIKEFFISKIPKNATMLVDVDEDANIEILSKELKQNGIKLVFVYSDKSSKKLEILKRKFEYASFIERKMLSEEMLKLI